MLGAYLGEARFGQEGCIQEGVRRADCRGVRGSGSQLRSLTVNQRWGWHRSWENSGWWSRGRGRLEKLLCQGVCWVWGSRWEVRWAKRRAVGCWRGRVVGLGACRLVDQIGEEEVSVTELVRLGRLDLVVLRGCIRS